MRSNYYGESKEWNEDIHNKADHKFIKFRVFRRIIFASGPILFGERVIVAEHYMYTESARSDKSFVPAFNTDIDVNTTKIILQHDRSIIMDCNYNIVSLLDVEKLKAINLVLTFFQLALYYCMDKLNSIVSVNKSISGMENIAKSKWCKKYQFIRNIFPDIARDKKLEQLGL